MLNEVTVQSVRREHGEIHGLVRQLHAVAKDLDGGLHAGIQPVLASLIDQMQRHLYREMRQEEAQIYPFLPAALGTDVPMRVLQADHRAVRDLVDGLRELNRPDAHGWSWEERASAIRSRVRRLAALLVLHLRREEAAFSALLVAGGREPQPHPPGAMEQAG